MIKFFRKIREKFLSENKFSKYALYAFGEILLVVIGILIALSFNNSNERKKSEAKTAVVFNDLLGELASDIESIKSAGRFYAKKDSLSYLVLQTDIKREDYQNNYNIYRWLLRSRYITNLSNNAYNKLLQLSESIPSEYNEVMNELYKLNQEKQYIDLMSNNMSQYVRDITQYHLYHYSWTTDFNIAGMVDYFTNDRYKSDVKLLYLYGVNEHYEYSQYYLKRAIRCYKKIAVLLNKPVDFKLLGYDPEMAKILIGNWKPEQNPGLIMTIYEVDNRLLYKNNTNSNTGEYYSISKTKFINSIGVQFNTIIKKENEIIIKDNRGTEWKKMKG